MLEIEILKKRLAELSPEKQDALMHLLRQKGIEDSQLPIIARRQASDKFPLTSAQLGLWFLQQLDPDSPVYNVPIGVRLTGSLNVAALKQSITEVVRRHEILRTTFPSIDGQPVQLISSDGVVKLPVVNLRKLSEFELEGEAQRAAIEQIEQPFDLTQEPPWRFKLVELAEEEYLLLLTIHHIIFDGKSLNTFLRELSALYGAFSANQPSPLPELPIQYADFACWEQQCLQSKELESQITYWQKKLGGSVPPLELPIDRLRPTIHTYQGSRQSLVLRENLTNGLNMLSLEEGVTLFMTLLAAFKTLLYCYSKQEDILLASPVTGHDRSETEALIGYFNNILLMRTDLSGNPSFRDLIGRVKQTALEAYQNRNVSLQKLGEMPNLARTPLSRGMFALYHIRSQPLELPGLTVRFLDSHNRTANFDLSLLMEEKEEMLTAVLEYKTALFEAATIIQMLENFQSLLESLVVNPDQRLSDLPLLREPELPQLDNRNDSLDKTKQKLEENFVAPRDELEQQLTQIWEKVFGIQPIGIHDNFFELGGHSLLAVKLFAQIEKTFKKNLPLSALFQGQTVEQLAKILHQEGWSSSWYSLLPIQPNGSKPPLFAIHQLGEGLKIYRPLANYLGPEQPIYGLRYGLAAQTANSEEEILPSTVEELAAHYVREMRSLQPEGPYFLATVCGGGLIALEMAQQLQSVGQEVGFLALFDAFGPGGRVLLPIHKRFFSALRGVFQLKPADTLYRLKTGLNRALRNRKTQPAPQIVYSPKTYSGRVILFRPTQRRVTLRYEIDPQLGWGGVVTGGLEVHDFPVDHYDMLREPHVQIVAEKLKVYLDTKEEIGANCESHLENDSPIKTRTDTTSCLEKRAEVDAG